MTTGRLSRRGEFTPVPSHGSTFVYMIPPQNVILISAYSCIFNSVSNSGSGLSSYFFECCTGANIARLPCRCLETRL